MVLIAAACIIPACNQAGSFTLTSSAFGSGSDIPRQYTCDGLNISPPLSWEGAPEDTKSFSLIVHDPDARIKGGFTHWLLIDIPAGSKSLEENVAKTVNLPNGATQGNNSSNAVGYTGPCPPAGPAHHYNFTLYALDKTLALKPGGITQRELEEAMKGHILAKAKLTGVYQRG